MIPYDAKVHTNLGILFANMPGHQEQAIAHFEAAQHPRPAARRPQARPLAPAPSHGRLT